MTVSRYFTMGQKDFREGTHYMPPDLTNDQQKDWVDGYYQAKQEAHKASCASNEERRDVDRGEVLGDG